jgi:hypothetical protein
VRVSAVSTIVRPLSLDFPKNCPSIDGVIFHKLPLMFLLYEKSRQINACFL